MKLTGTKITLVAECSGIDGTWGYRERELRDLPQGRRQDGRRRSSKAGNDVVAGDCHLANGGILAGDRHACRCTRSRSSPAPTASPRRTDPMTDDRASSPSTTSPTCAPTSASATSSAPHVIALKKRRRVARRPVVTLRVREPRHDPLPDPGDGPGREAHHRRGDRGRARHLQPAHPRARARCRRRCSSSSPATTALREWLPKLVGIERDDRAAHRRRATTPSW